MSRITLLLTLCSLCDARLPAQPVLDGSSAPQVGQLFTFIHAEHLDLPGTGPDAVWDATNANPFGGGAMQVIDPGSANASGLFPASDLVELAMGDEERYVDVQPDGLLALGLYTFAAELAIVFSDPSRYLPFPCALDTTWADFHSAQYTFAGNTYTLAGGLAFTATGYGTLQLPWGELTNVLRIDGSEFHTTVGGGDTIEYVSEVSYFHKPGFGSHVARLFSETIVSNGFPTDEPIEEFHYIHENSIGMHGLNASSPGVQVSPNPAVGEAVVLLTATGHTTIELVDARGALVHRQELGPLGAGVHRVVIDISGLSPGVHTLIVRNARERGVARLVVQR